MLIGWQRSSVGRIRRAHGGGWVEFRAALVRRLLDGGERPTTAIANGSGGNTTMPAFPLVGYFAWMHSLARLCGRAADGLKRRQARCFSCSRPLAEHLSKCVSTKHLLKGGSLLVFDCTLCGGRVCRRCRGGAVPSTGEPRV